MHHSHSRSEKKQKEDELRARVGTWGWLIAVEDLPNCDLNGQTKNECLSQSDALMSAITPDPSFDIFEIAAAATPSLRTPPHKDLCRRRREITPGGRAAESISLPL